MACRALQTRPTGPRRSPEAARKLQRGAQASQRGCVEPKRALVESREVGDDRETKPRARLRLVQAATPLQHVLHGRFGQAGTVVLDRDAQVRPVVLLDDANLDGDAMRGPFARVVDEVPSHFLKILPLAPESRSGLRRNRDRKVLFAINLLEC